MIANAISVIVCAISVIGVGGIVSGSVGVSIGVHGTVIAMALRPTFGSSLVAAVEFRNSMLT